jgi:hypothetical protein
MHRSASLWTIRRMYVTRFPILLETQAEKLITVRSVSKSDGTDIPVAREQAEDRKRQFHCNLI